MRNFVDGSYYVKDRKRPYVLYVTIYGDDFCTANPIGGASKEHTFTAVYMRVSLLIVFTRTKTKLGKHWHLTIRR